MREAQQEKSKPTLIRLKTVIAWPAPKAKGTAESHGSALGADEVASTKSALGLDPEKSFIVPSDVLAHARKVGERGAAIRTKWLAEFKTWQASNPEKSALLSRLQTKELPAGWEKVIPEFESGKDLMSTLVK